MDQLFTLVKRHSGMDHGSMNHSSMGHHDHSSMGHDHGGGSGCKFSMVFHSTTIDSCFLSDKWRITSTGMFAGSCIGVFLLAVTLELIRRLVKEYDRFLARKHLASHDNDHNHRPVNDHHPSKEATSVITRVAAEFRPTIYQQAVRAFLQLLLITCAWTLMLLVMYFNVYLTLSILLGFYVGSFVFQWDNIPIGSGLSRGSDAVFCCS
ncbi:hypothetical protein L249_0527 [Ophiocordyceps polyrhachis-furcata BCC 54312]|uniref:Copper transport protein n=1 Tax=Ophiocordyceps polyrhachis-furcata BCC 54312 TaxID=1330021 RepID=A0A367LE99_9HYPO|nr:hypothetical protein L249_0527 [Ophiocordyceps polyrhachis-furcata BCC 54312]